MIRNVHALTAASYTSMFFLGVGSTIIGAAARNIDLSPYQIGLLLTIQNLGFIISVILSGGLSDIYEKTKILFAGSCVLAISFGFFYRLSSFQINLSLMFLIGVGTGTYEGVSDAMLIEIHRKKESLYININHFFATFGSLMITLYLIFLQMNWRSATVQSGIAVGVLALFFLLSAAGKGDRSEEPLSSRLRFLLGEKTVSILFASTICTVGLELGSVGIMTTYLMEQRGFNQITSKICLLIFLAGIATGRLLVGFFSRKNQIPRFVLILFGSATIFLGTLYFTELGWFTYGLIFFSGMTISALLPLLITLGGVMYKDMAGTVLGIIKIAIPIGGILIPLLISVLSKYSSFKTSLLLFPFISGIGFLIMFINLEKFHKFNLDER
ncbi:MAG: MFS transporter [Spirochaetota bacterium]